MLKKMEIKDFDQVYTLMEEVFRKTNTEIIRNRRNCFKIQSIRF